MGKYFGTDGFRGEANIDLTVEHAFKIGRYLGYYFNKDKKNERARIVIGKDTRRSSYMYEYAIISGITASGADAYMLHVTTTPSVSYITRSDQFDCGVMISASHNPYYDNGIKLINRNGHKMEAEVEDEIEAYIDGIVEEIPLAKRDAIGCALDYSVGRNRYIAYLMSIPTRAFRGYRVGLDCANGASFMIAKAVFDALGAKTYVINNDPDGLNINLECGSTHIDKLRNFVVEKHLDMGFAYDGDADRCIAVDEYGKEINGDFILYMCGLEMKKRGELANNTIVTTVMSNMGLYKALDREGINYEKTAVGDKYVYENMMANGHVLGGEQSGHIIFAKHATTGDGILTSLKIMEAVINNKSSLMQLSHPVKIYPQALENVHVTDKQQAQDDADVKQAVAEVAESLGDDGRILVRASGTEPVVRVMVEAATDQLCHENCMKVVDVMKKKGYISE